jgi:hypothetical protein
LPPSPPPLSPSPPPPSPPPPSPPLPSPPPPDPCRTCTYLIYWPDDYWYGTSATALGDHCIPGQGDSVYIDSYSSTRAQDSQECYTTEEVSDGYETGIRHCAFAVWGPPSPPSSPLPPPLSPPPGGKSGGRRLSDTAGGKSGGLRSTDNGFYLGCYSAAPPRPPSLPPALPPPHAATQWGAPAARK